MSIQPLPGERRPRPRIETLADLVFGLSLSIGAIGLIASAPSTQSEINSHIYAFGFTFLVLITAWIARQFWEWTLFGVPPRLYIWYLPLISYWVGRFVRPQSRTYRIS